MACEQVSDTASYINTHIKNYDNTQRMVEIQKRLGGEKKLNIMEPGRVFIREGMLNKVRRSRVLEVCAGLCLDNTFLEICKSGWNPTPEDFVVAYEPAKDWASFCSLRQDKVVKYLVL